MTSPSSPGFTPAQLARLRADPPEIHTRRAPGNRTVQYIPIHAARQLANEIFGEDRWSDRIVSEAVLSERGCRKSDRNGAQTQVFRVVARHTLELKVLTPEGAEIVRAGIGLGSAEAPADGDLAPAYQALKIAKANALTNALKSFGRAFGIHLNPPQNPLPGARLAVAAQTAETPPRSEAASPPAPKPQAQTPSAPARPNGAARAAPSTSPTANGVQALCQAIHNEILLTRSDTELRDALDSRRAELETLAMSHPQYQAFLKKAAQEHAADITLFRGLKNHARTIPDLAAWQALGQMHAGRLDAVKGRNPAFHAEIIDWCKGKSQELAAPSTLEQTRPLHDGKATLTLGDIPYKP